MLIQAQKFIHSLQVMYENWAVSFNREVFIHSWTEELEKLCVVF